MSPSFGPWATQIDVGPRPALDSFWKRRMGMLATVRRCKQRLGRSAIVGLLAAALAILAVPTFRASQAAAPQEPPGETAAAGESPATETASPSTARSNAADPTATVEELIERLYDRDPAVRGNAAEALGKLGPAAAPAVPALIEALADPGSRDVIGPPDKYELDSQGVLSRRTLTLPRSTSVSTTAEEALAAIGSPAVEPLFAVARDPQCDPSIRQRVGAVLRRVDDPRIATLLIDRFEGLLDDRSDRSRNDGTRIVRGGNSTNLVVDPFEVFRAPGDPAPALAAADLLREELRGPEDAAIFSNMLRYLNMFRGMLGTRRIRISMRDDAREALTGVLREHLGDSSLEVRAMVVELIARFGVEGSEALRRQLGESLGEHARDESANVRLAVALAQAELEVKVDNADPLLDAAADEKTRQDPDLRLRVISGLGKSGDPRAVPVLVAALKDPKPEVRSAAAGSLRGIKVPATVDALLLAIHDSDEGVASSALFSLLRIADPSAVPPLLAFANESDNADLRIDAGMFASMIARPNGGDSEIAWGEPVGDLQLGLRRYIAGNPVHFGEVVEYHWIIRNQGARDWTIRMNRTQNRRPPVEGRDIDLGAAEPRGPSRAEDSGWILVRAETSILIGAKAYCFRSEDWEGSDLPRANDLHLSPGRYQVHASFAGTVRGDAAAEEITRATLTSGTLELEVADIKENSPEGGVPR